MNFQSFLQRSLLGNTIETWCWVLGIILLGLILKKVISRLLTLAVFRFVRRYSTGVGYEKLMVLLQKPFGLFILLITFYLAFSLLDFPESWKIASAEKFGLRMFIWRSYEILIIICVTWIFLRITDFFGLVLMYRASLTESKADDQLVPFIKESIKVIISILAFFFVLGAVFKLNVASLIAGLGIGGLAVALAAKESLENLFGSFTIFLDKPFVLGDLIKVGGVEGTVEKIGFRSTRIRTHEKSFVTVPNKKLVDGELDNLSLRLQRRARFSLVLSYETKPEDLKNIVAQIQAYIDNHPHVYKEETRVRMYGFGPSGIDVAVLYFVDTMEYDVYLNVREEVNYKIMDIIAKNNSGFAYPVLTPVKKTQEN
jgi:MscS family membrane protein